MDAVLGGEFPRPVPAEQAGFGGYDSPRQRRHRQYLLGSRGRTGTGALPGRSPGSGGTCYGAEKAALERFTQGLAMEMYQYGISVTCVAPSQVVPTPGTVFHNLVSSMDDPRGEPPELMAQAVLLLATEPWDQITGRVTYSQRLLQEFSRITQAQGRGVDPELPGTGYRQV